MIAKMSESPNSYHRSNSTIAEDSQLTSFAPYIQAFLTQTSRRYYLPCCNVMLPLAFERAAPNSFVNPKFDSQVLEQQYQLSIFPQIRLRFRFCLIYICSMTMVWMFYFAFRAKEVGTPLNFTLGSLIIISLLSVWITFSKYYKSHMTTISIVYVFFLVATMLSMVFYSTGTALSVSGNFSIAIICIICIYTVIPLKFYQCFLTALIYSVLFEVLSFILRDKSYYHEEGGFQDIKLFKIIAIRIFCHISAHIISFHMLIMSTVRMRGTFIKVGQNLLVRRQLELEKQLKEKMIQSMMPKVVADMLLKEVHPEQEVSAHRHRPSTSDLNLNSMFRPFHMHKQTSVSILFADIVGFTKMSSTKSAEQLVEILNDLFERFDSLCAVYGCEKISTLGDCYYAVSGCPNVREDHAFCCVEMGLSMIETMRIFDSERHENIKMRVGIHTGNVLCGIVGTKRVKFDVWSNDVTFANKMESTGKPDSVHISEETRTFIKDTYNLQNADDVDGHKTYFILGRKNNEKSLMIEKNLRKMHLELRSDKHKNLSTNDIPSIPAVSPTTIAIQHSKSLSPSPILNTRKRLASISETVSKFLSSNTANRLNEQRKNPNPKIVVIESTSENSNTSESKGTDINGTILEESVPLSTIHVDSGENPRSITCCDKLNENLVPYNETRSGLLVSSSSIKNDFSNPASSSGHDEKEYDDSSVNIAVFDLLQSRCPSASSPFSRSKSGSTHNRSHSQQSNSLSPWYHHQSPSRKDSGVKSNSRRSRYFSSSQSSLCPGTDYQADDMQMKHMPSPTTGSFQKTNNDTLKACVQHLRKQSDLQLIKCVRDNARSQRSYPIRRFSLSFESSLMEKTFRNKAHRYECEEDSSTPIYTLATPKFNTFIDVLVLSVIFGMIALSLFFLSPNIYSREYRMWVVLFVCSSFAIFSVWFLCLKQICRRRDRVFRQSSHFNSIFGWFSGFYIWNILGSILISLPVVSILANFALVDVKKYPSIQFYYSILCFVCLIHFCNFIQLNCWTKNILALAFGMVFTFIGYNQQQASGIILFRNYEFELALFLCWILVFLLNREFEIGYRLSFYGNEVANQDKVRVQNMKNQADLLLHNIIPRFVAEELKNTSKYSKNHQDVGILFASIVNFNEMYDESYLGGKEYLRVLNELIGDFDELLLRSEFKCVEKIKTIGSTYMAASGLDSKFRNDTYEHLFALLDFAVSMQNAIECFNRDLLEFNLVLRIGFNYGEVTAGVIGTTKLHYDIWGDSVNVASRMDSCGVSNRIQLRSECTSIFEDLYEFEYRGKVFVKGKDMMDVSLLKFKKEETLEVFQDHQLT